MADFITTVNRITSELRRSNLATEAKNAIYDAINEASKTRFYFNEMRAVPLVTVPGQEYYDDAGLVEIDALWYVQGNTRYNLYLENNLDADARADGNNVNGQLESYSRQGTSIRLYPVPAQAYNVFADGYGKLSPLVDDTDTNNWLSYGERYIRALAKSIMLKDVIRDYGEATALQAIAEDQRQLLVDETTQRLATGTVRPTQW